ncbi:MAG: PQQ-dependent dehydrogenase, methanol/ethanol family [Gammaproteobacteria bacterium]|nr:PQQ-dependent dehydrogenase, methanol/ethanol family [Gammaproteobacteria bacterium]
MNAQLLSSLALSLFFSIAFAQGPSTSELLNDENESDNVVVYGMGYSQQRHSTLQKINKKTVSSLAPKWIYSLDDDRGQQAFPMVYDGVIYFVTHDSTIAVDALDGKQKWKQKIEYDKEALKYTCCGVTNRGAAIYDNKIFRGGMDGKLYAYNMSDGELLWQADAFEDIEDWTGLAMNVAPLVANGILISGVSGGDYGARCFIDGWDPQTGKRIWRRYTIPGPGEVGNDTWPGDTWKRGGGSTWLTGSYDPELDLVYWGVGNPGPYNPSVRVGDNLYTNSVLAIKPASGEVIWHFQFSPNDPFDYDGNNEFIITDLKIKGETRKVILQASRNGFFYVIDRRNGEFITANEFVKVNWAEGLDAKGKPIESSLLKKLRSTGEEVTVWPAGTGGKNWSPMAYDPSKQTAYVNTNHYGFTYKYTKVKYRPGLPYFGVKFDFSWDKDTPYRGYLKAIDPLTGKARWKVPQLTPNYSAVLSTAGGLIFTGTHTGEFIAYDKDDGKELWSFQTGSGIVGQPISWSHEGKQYITIASGIGGLYSRFAGDERLKNVPKGGNLITFGLLQ